MPDSSLSERLLALWDHLGLGRAHVASQIPADLAELVARHPARVAGVVLCAPVRLDAAPFTAVAHRLLMITGDRGLAAEATERAVARLAGAQRSVLSDYETLGWTDIVAERTAAVAQAMIAHLSAAAAADPPRPGAREGNHAGITYRIEGAGPALVLLPFFLAPSQWQPALPMLARHFSVVVLGGPELGGIAMLEDRARAPTYQAMFRTLIDLLAPRPGDAILDVGCGSGALDRPPARRLGGAKPLTAVDAHPFPLRDAAALAHDDGLSY